MVGRKGSPCSRLPHRPSPRYSCPPYELDGSMIASFDNSTGSSIIEDSESSSLYHVRQSHGGMGIVVHIVCADEGVPAVNSIPSVHSIPSNWIVT